MSEEVEDFTLRFRPSMNMKSGEAFVQFGIEGTKYNTTWTPEEAMDVSTGLAAAAFLAEYQANVYAFLVNVFGIGADEANSFLDGVARYAQEDENGKANMKEASQKNWDAMGVSIPRMG